MALRCPRCGLANIQSRTTCVSCATRLKPDPKVVEPGAEERGKGSISEQLHSYHAAPSRPAHRGGASADAGPSRSVEPPGQGSSFGMNWPALFSFRVWMSSGCLGFLVFFAVVLVLSVVGINAAEGTAGTVLAVIIFLPVFLFALFAQVTDKSHVLYCPHCRKRVKMGADRCHHCGQMVR